MQVGQMTQVSDQVDLPRLIRETVAPYQKNAVKKGVEFQLDTHSSPQLIIGDSRKVACVVANLTANAGKASHVGPLMPATADVVHLEVKFTETGVVTIDCKTFDTPDALRESHASPTPREVAVEIVVTDTGCGIPNNKLEEIFRQFELVDHEDEEPRQSQAEAGEIGRELDLLEC